MRGKEEAKGLKRKEDVYNKKKQTDGERNAWSGLKKKQKENCRSMSEIDDNLQRGKLAQMSHR